MRSVEDSTRTKAQRDCCDKQVSGCYSWSTIDFSAAWFIDFGASTATMKGLRTGSPNGLRLAMVF